MAIALLGQTKNVTLPVRSNLAVTRWKRTRQTEPLQLCWISYCVERIDEKLSLCHGNTRAAVLVSSLSQFLNRRPYAGNFDH